MVSQCYNNEILIVIFSIRGKAGMGNGTFEVDINHSLKEI